MRNVRVDNSGVKWRTCKVCKKELLFETHFSLKNGKQTPHWRRTECKQCMKTMNRNKNAAKRSAPPMPDNCECCGRPRNGKALCCDHIHGTQKFRGWICRDCNLGIGMTIDHEHIGWRAPFEYYKKNDPEVYKQMKKYFLEDK